MTRPNQKEEEREIVERLLSVIGLRAEIDDKGEKPDIVLKMPDCTIGVEVTTYASAKTVASASGKPFAQRTIEAAWEDLESNSKRFRSEHPDLKDIGVIFFFKMEIPSKNKYSEFLSEIRRFILSKRSYLGREFTVYSNHELTSKSMVEYLSDIAINIHEDAAWDSNKTSGFVDRPGHTISCIIANKSTKAKNYRKIDETWLVIEKSGRPSETILITQGIGEFNNDAALRRNVEGSPFSRVYVFTAMGLLVWSRLGEWQWRHQPAPV